MNDLPRQKLCEITEQYGQSVLDNPRRCKALLMDFCGQHKREIFVLITAMEEKIPQDLRASTSSIPPAVLAAQLIRRLVDNRALAHSAAQWAVKSWAEALEIALPLDVLDSEWLSRSPPLPVERAGMEQTKPERTKRKPGLAPTKAERVEGKRGAKDQITGRAFSSTQRVEVLGRHPAVPNTNWRELGTTPGIVPIPEPYVARLRAHSLDDAGLATLAKDILAFDNIEELDLLEVHTLTGAGLAHLRTLSNLNSLNIWGGTQITDAGLVHLRPLTALSNLKLWQGTQITDAGLAHLRPLYRLTSLDLAWCAQVTDKGLGHICELSRLTWLSLEGCKQITDRGLARLRLLTNLKSLNLSRCPQISNKGLVYLRALPNLKSVHLDGCERVSTRGIAALEKTGVTIAH